MSEEQLLEYLSKLWAMLIWGNKQYVVDKLLAGHGLAVVREEIACLLWSDAPIAARWERFRGRIKGMGPAMMSELLSHVHPQSYLLWNRRAYVGLDYLGVSGLPKHNYQVTGSKYAELCEVGKRLARELRTAGVKDADLLDVDYFIWEELQVEDNLSRIGKKESSAQMSQEVAQADSETAEFIHNEVKEKLADIGQWLGFSSKTEVKVADGSVVDTVWESTIGNMGRVIYVFEVQTKGSVDSLLMNLLKALNNAAVQGVVAVSDTGQLDKIRKHAAGVAVLREKLRYWDYTDVLATHEALEGVNASINQLGLVPQGFAGK
ncbi:hypothetical protein FKV24_007155 [Lysobacter maris]|uniref:Uncharacterized protein n=2 Tax=Marilutibacter maris TaxID=1605891 RepID=A0A508ASN9_9GAMM|nr:hypothetical protein FKV24_007155 [Lysobacter maris]